MNQNETFTAVISFAMTLMVLGFVCSLVGGMMKAMAGSSSSPKQLSQGSEMSKKVDSGYSRNYLSYKEMVAKLGNRLNSSEGVAELKKEMEKAPTSEQGIYWHFTPKERLPSIKNRGLLVSSPRLLSLIEKGKVRKGVVFLVQDKWSCVLFSVSQVDLGIIDPGEYALLGIKMPYSIKVYQDPSSKAFFGGVYVKENIPPEYITVDEIIYIPEESEWLGYID